MSYAALKAVFPSFGEQVRTYAQHNYQAILDRHGAAGGGAGASSQPAGEPAPVPTASSHSSAPALLPPARPPARDASMEPRRVDMGRGAEAFAGGDAHSQAWMHVMQCEACQGHLQQRLVHGASVIDDSLVEMATYVLFGVFVLVLLETQQRRG